MKDYYRILGVDPSSSEEEIRRAYRKLALRFHPDRNPQDPSAEERFKEVNEAYGVLGDPRKRAAYDGQRGPQEGLEFTQEEILQDLFRDPAMNRVFQELLKEFQRAGVRFDRGFFDQVFFGGRGVLVGGIFIFGPFMARPKWIFGHKRKTSGSNIEVEPAGLLERLGRRLGGYLKGRESKAFVPSQPALSESDLTYELRIPMQEALSGTQIRIAVDRGFGKESLRVRIPPGTRSGTTLRLRGKGLQGPRGTGDLYIRVMLDG